MDTWIPQLRKGLVELCVLAALAEGEAYGYDIVRRLGEHDGLGITESAVYPILARLSRDGLVKVRAAPSPSGPPRRYYRLTRLGEETFAQMHAQWRMIRDAVDTMTAAGLEHLKKN